MAKLVVAIPPLWFTYKPLAIPVTMGPRSDQFHFSIGPLRRTKKGITFGDPHFWFGEIALKRCQV